MIIHGNSPYIKEFDVEQRKVSEVPVPEGSSPSFPLLRLPGESGEAVHLDF